MAGRIVDGGQVEDVKRPLSAKVGGDWFANIEIQVVYLLAGKARLSNVYAVQAIIPLVFDETP